MRRRFFYGMLFIGIWKGACDMDTEEKRREEMDTMREILTLYCKAHHHAPAAGKDLCADCDALLGYALHRIEKCPRMAVKTFCAVCPVHCYAKEPRAKIKEVMRYAGLRMILHHPFMTLRHMLIQWRSRARR